MTESTSNDKAVEVSASAEQLEADMKKAQAELKAAKKAAKAKKAAAKAQKDAAKKAEKEAKKAQQASVQAVAQPVAQPVVQPVATQVIYQTTKKPHVGLAIFLAILSILTSATSLTFSILSYNKSNTPLTILQPGVDGNVAEFVEGSIAEVVDKVSVSVVSIETEIKTTSFFGQSYSSAAAGTGVIVSGDGYILTNKHVINGASAMKVILYDGTTYDDVKLAAYDPLNDIAFIKINNVSDLPKAELGDSKTITAGQQVIAIGNALGQYQNTVSSGIISGTGRTITASDSTGTNSETLNDMIQTDAAINSGNSGGPLVNAAGQVIGINTATTTSANNIGFAIPISSVKGMLSSLLETGSAKRAYIGVYSTVITPAVAKEYNLPVTSGAYIYSPNSYSAIIADGPAAKGGLKDKDIVTAINGVKVGTTGSISSLVGEYKPGDIVQFTVLRGGDEIAINITLGAYED